MGFVKFCWVVTFLATLGAGVELLFTLTAAQSAPQQAAGAAMAAAMVVVPYVFTRAMEGLWGVQGSLEKHIPAAPTDETPTATLDLSR